MDVAMSLEPDFLNSQATSSTKTKPQSISGKTVSTHHSPPNCATWLRRSWSRTLTRLWVLSALRRHHSSSGLG